MNTFAQLVQAAQSLKHTEILGREEPPTSEEMVEFVNANKPHLDAAREALSHECYVELEYTEDFFEKHMDDVRPMRDLARAFRLELAAAEREGRLADAVRAGVSGLDLAGAVRRGGLITDLLVAVALSGISVDALRQIRHRLAVDELRLLLRELQRVETQREAFADITARDEDWDRRFPCEEEFDPSKMEWPESDGEDGLDEEAQRAIHELIANFANRSPEEKVQTNRDIDNRDLAGIRLLAVESALLACRLTCDALPESLDGLEPEFLAEVPCDPYTDEPFRYRVEGDDFILYSVGPSKQDAGGRIGSWLDVSYHGADLFLDVSDLDGECGCFGCCSVDNRKPGIFAALMEKLRRLTKRVSGLLR